MKFFIKLTMVISIFMGDFSPNFICENGLKKRICLKKKSNLQDLHVTKSKLRHKDSPLSKLLGPHIPILSVSFID